MTTRTSHTSPTSPTAGSSSVPTDAQRPAAGGFPGAVPNDDAAPRQPWTRTDAGSTGSSTGAREPRPSRGWSTAAVSHQANRHGDSLLLRTVRPLSRLILSDAFPQDWAAAVDTSQQPVTTGRRIGVLSPAGGSGRSTVVAALARLYAQVRADDIAAVDLSGSPAGLHHRLPADDGPSTAIGLSGLTARQPEHPDATGGVLSRYAAAVQPRLHRLTESPRPGVPPQALETDDVAAVHRTLSRACAVSLYELPGLEQLRRVQMLSRLHALIVPVAAHPAAPSSSRMVIEHLRETVPGMGVLPVLVDVGRVSAMDQQTAARGLRDQFKQAGFTQPVRRLDADRHLATGLRLDLARVGEKRRLQLAQLAAAGLDVAVRSRR